MKRWQYRFHTGAAMPGSHGGNEKSPNLEEVAQRLGVPSIVATLLWQRGLSSFDEMNIFLSPGLRHLSNPNAWQGMSQAVDALERGIWEGKSVLIWGDYDVDGITGATLMLQVLAFHHVPVRIHLPNRTVEGYGLNIPKLEAWATELQPENTLLLTVDCGISDLSAVARANELGFTVVISDHHLPPAELPAAQAIINPRIGQNPCPYLAGVGVAFFLMAALSSRLEKWSGKKLDIREMLDLVALGTLADMVPLTGQNRILVKNGLLTVKEARRPGLAELKIVSGFTARDKLGPGQIVFSLAPRINASGRLGNPMLAHTLLNTDSYDDAKNLATELNKLNDSRRSAEDTIFTDALQQAKAEHNRMGLVLYGQSWHQGIIGIVASRIVEELYLPVLILCRDGNVIKGSGRSIPEFDLHAGLTRCADLLLGYGGHKQAAGLRLAPEQLTPLRERFDAVVREALGDTPYTPTLNIDAELTFTEATDFTVLKGLELLQPFGMGNPEPVFVSTPLVVQKRRTFGRANEHVTLEVKELDSGRTLQAKAWRQAGQIPAALINRHIRLAYTPVINVSYGTPTVELRIRDWEILPNNSNTEGQP